MTSQANALITSNSPYLLQHAYNPVQWLPFSQELIQNSQSKLIIISIGYSACHWCHVMEHESFENPEVADIMNSHFLNIKVDKEEHPHIDKIYMKACQAMTGGGGWPLNVICTPDGVPIHAGTYFPRQKWIHLLQTIQELYKTKPEQIETFKVELLQILNKPTPDTSSITLPALQKAIENHIQTLDFDTGGMMGSPKFPMPVLLYNCINWSIIFNQTQLQQHVNLTLLKMAQGGLWDWVQGGFARYSVDDQWFVPHFEKMLYDNAQLLPLYAQSIPKLKLPILEQVSRQIIEFVQNHLKLSNGLYAAALDADTELGEGAYYCLTIDECYAHLNEQQMAYCQEQMQFTALGNWEHGLNIVRFYNPPQARMQATGMSATQLETFENQILSIFAAIRKSKKPPMQDYKAVCSFNALLLSGLSQVIPTIPQAQEIAQELAQAMQAYIKPNGLWHQISNNKPQFEALLCDYSFFIQALLNYSFHTQQAHYCNQALQLLEIASKNHFHSNQWHYQAQAQTQFTTATDSEDDVMPSSLSSLSLSLLYISNLYALPQYYTQAQQLISTHQQAMLQHPFWHSQWISAWVHAFAQNPILICSNTQAYNNAINNAKQHLPLTIPIVNAQIFELPITAGKYSAQEQYYICLQSSCLAPVNTTEQAVEILLDYFNIQ